MLALQHIGVNEGNERTAKGDIVKVGWWLDGLELSADIEVLDLAAKVCHGRVSRVVCTEDLHSLFDLIRLVDVVD